MWYALAIVTLLTAFPILCLATVVMWVWWFVEAVVDLGVSGICLGLAAICDSALSVIDPLDNDGWWV